MFYSDVANVAILCCLLVTGQRGLDRTNERQMKLKHKFKTGRLSSYFLLPLSLVLHQSQLSKFKFGLVPTVVQLPLLHHNPPPIPSPPQQWSVLQHCLSLNYPSPFSILAVVNISSTQHSSAKRLSFLFSSFDLFQLQCSCCSCVMVLQKEIKLVP